MKSTLVANLMLCSLCALIASGCAATKGAEDGKLFTLAVRRGDGKILWRQAIAANKPREIHKKNHPSAATPATHGRNLCVYHAGFGLAAYNFDGRELWRKPMPGLLTRNGSGTSPAMLDGRLLLN